MEFLQILANMHFCCNKHIQIVATRGIYSLAFNKNDFVDQYLNDEPPRNSRRREVGGICVSGMGLI